MTVPIDIFTRNEVRYLAMTYLYDTLVAVVFESEALADSPFSVAEPSSDSTCLFDPLVLLTSCFTSSTTESVARFLALAKLFPYASVTVCFRL